MTTTHTHEFYAMGCHMAVWLAHEDKKTAVSATKHAENIFRTAEKQLTRFSADSELSQLNAQTGRWMHVSPNLWEITHRAVEMAAATGGLFDPTLLNALEASGYNRTFNALNETAVSCPYHAENGRFQAIEFDEANRAIKLPAGVRLDLGGIAKGYTADQAVAYLNSFGPCLVDAGGDLVAGQAPEEYQGWPVGVAAPWSDDGQRNNLFRLWLAEASLTTSGIDYRRWVQNGRLHHHIIDPRNGQPAATDIMTVSVLAENGCVAETWSTAALVAGLQEGSALLNDQEMAAAFINQNGDVSLTPALAPQIQWEWATVLF